MQFYRLISIEDKPENNDIIEGSSDWKIFGSFFLLWVLGLWAKWKVQNVGLVLQNLKYIFNNMWIICE